ncbi:hypothetical protein D3C80_1326390 [compost metagenome]
MRVDIQLVRQQMKVQALELQRRFLAKQLQRGLQALFVETEGGRFTAHHQPALRGLGKLQVEPQHDRCAHAAFAGDASQAAQFGHALHMEG